MFSSFSFTQIDRMYSAKAALPLLFCLLFILTHTASAAGPSRGFLQEFGMLANAGQLSVDVLNTSGGYAPHLGSELRAGSPIGELILSQQSLGYKTLMRPRLAAYGHFSASTHKDDALQVRAGVAYRLRTHDALININPELQKNESSNALGVNIALFLRYPNPPSWLGGFHLGGEMGFFDDGRSPWGIAGVRWMPRPFLTIDMGLAGAGGGRGGITVKTPAALKVNVSI